MVRRSLVALVCMVAVVSAYTLSARASTGPTQAAKPVSWQQRDTAIYVVSTLNLVRTPNGETLAQILNPTRFNVYSANSPNDLYFVCMKGRNGAFLGALAYQIGWAKPQAISSFSDRFGLRRAPAQIIQMFRSGQRTLIGSFTTTLPSR